MSLRNLIRMQWTKRFLESVTIFVLAALTITLLFDTAMEEPFLFVYANDIWKYAFFSGVLSSICCLLIIRTVHNAIISVSPRNTSIVALQCVKVVFLAFILFVLVNVTLTYSSDVQKFSEQAGETRSR